MKARTVVLCCLAAVIILSLNSQPNWAKSKSSDGLSIGVLKIRKIFEQCKKNEEYKQMMTAEQEKAVAELEKLRAELDAEKAGLRTVKVGSTEHMALMKQLLTKQANYEAQQQFHQQQMAIKEQQWIELLYRDVVRITAAVAEEKGLDLVLEGSEPELSDTTAESLVMSIRTHKLLYSGGCEDITDEVMARLDAGK
jgi:Skp family chaperone for outer membrane proteins